MPRRKFIKTLAAGVGLGTLALSACGDNTPAPASLPAAPLPVATTAPAATATPLPANTPTAVPPTSSPTAVPSTSSPTPASTSTPTAKPAPATTVAPNTAPSAFVTTAAAPPVGFVQVAKNSAAAAPISFKAGNKSGFVYIKSGGEALVYSNICTHQGCEVAYNASAGKIICPCHGSQYSLSGEVTEGPATLRLQLFESKVVGEIVYARLA